MTCREPNSDPSAQVQVFPVTLPVPLPRDLAMSLPQLRASHRGRGLSRATLRSLSDLKFTDSISSSLLSLYFLKVVTVHLHTGKKKKKNKTTWLLLYPEL